MTFFKLPKFVDGQYVICINKGLMQFDLLQNFCIAKLTFAMIQQTSFS